MVAWASGRRIARAIGTSALSGSSLLLACGRIRKGISEPLLLTTDRCAPAPNATPQNSTWGALPSSPRGFCGFGFAAGAGGGLEEWW